MAMELRPYQEDILTKMATALRGGERGTGRGVITRPAVAAATGAGKTVMFSHLLTDPRWTSRRITDGRRLVLVHRDELARQAAGTIRAAAPHTGDRVGIVRAEVDEHDADIVIASVQTIARRARRDRIRDVTMMIVDEAHHAAAPTWREALAHYGAWEGVPTSGWSATLSRSDDKALGDIWQEVVAQFSIMDGIRSGSLVDVRGVRVHVSDLDTSSVARSRGDVQAGQLSDALMDADAPAEVAAAYAEHAMTPAGAPRPGAVFAPTVASAEATAQALTDIGIQAEMISGATPLEERAEIYERYRTGRTRVLCNAMVLTEGWDAPWAEVAVIMRATQSKALYVQMVGRVLRPWPGKHQALVLDVVGVGADHGLATIVDLHPATREEGHLDPDAIDGMTLGEIDDSLDDLFGPDEMAGLDGGALSGQVRGELISRTFDPFANSRAVWLTTPKGTMFIPSGEWILFAWPVGEGLFTLGRIRNLPRKTKATVIDGYSDLPIDPALRHLEALALRNDPSLSRKNASWRKSGAASEKQLQFARSIKAPLASGMGKAEVSDAISVRIAELALD